MLSKTKKWDLYVMTEGALMVAMATVLSLISVYKAPFGGEVTLISMAPIIILSMRRGLGAGLAAGFVYSVIQLIFGLSNVAWVPGFFEKFLCILLDYLVPFTLLGIGGIFRFVRISKNPRTNLVISAFLAALTVTLIRYLCHILSGVVVWYALDLERYADDPSHIVNRYSMWMFSVVYNGAFMIPEIVMTCIGTPLVAGILPAAKKR